MTTATDPQASAQRWVRFSRGETECGFGTETDGVVSVHAGDMFADAERTGDQVRLVDVQVQVPCLPTKMVALWNNLRPVAERQGWAQPAVPLYFLKPSSCFVGNGASIVRPASYAGRILYEGELGVVIGKECVDVGMSDVDEVIFGYTCVNDVTAVDLIAEDPSFAQWSRAKSFDTFGAFGPVIATGLEPDDLTVRTTVGGRVRQEYAVKDMFFTPRTLVSLISRGMTLMPGDIIACGTSLGAMPMRPGTPVVVEIEGIGVLNNSLVE